MATMSGLMLEQHHAFAEKVASCVTFIVNTVRTCAISPAGRNLEEEGVGVGSLVCGIRRDLS